MRADSMPVVCGLMTDSPHPPAPETSCGEAPCPDEASSGSPSGPSMRSPSRPRTPSSGTGLGRLRGAGPRHGPQGLRGAVAGTGRTEAGDPRTPRLTVRRRGEEARGRRHRPHQARRGAGARTDGGPGGRRADGGGACEAASRRARGGALQVERRGVGSHGGQPAHRAGARQAAASGGGARAGHGASSPAVRDAVRCEQGGGHPVADVPAGRGLGDGAGGVQPAPVHRQVPRSGS